MQNGKFDQENLLLEWGHVT